jgi:hypothetical protein
MYPIAPTTATTPTQPIAPTPPPTGVQPAAAVDPTNAVSTTIDTIPASPPSEVLDAMGAASHRFDQLAAQGKHVGLQLSDDGGRVQVHVSDLEGNAISPPLAPSSIFSILEGQA